MSNLLIFVTIFITGNIFADSGYCHLESVPSVKDQIETLVSDYNKNKEDFLKIQLANKATQFTIAGMGDAFDFWGNEVLVFNLKEKNAQKHIVAFKVSFTAFFAKEFFQTQLFDANETLESFICLDTQEKNPEIMYFENLDSKVEMLQL